MSVQGFDQPMETTRGKRREHWQAYTVVAMVRTSALTVTTMLLSGSRTQWSTFSRPVVT